MKARIQNGTLHLERQGQFKPQRCPFSTTVPQQNCGDWCPLFGEPRQEHEEIATNKGTPIGMRLYWSLPLCHSVLDISSFEAADTRPIQHLPDTGFDQ